MISVRNTIGAVAVGCATLFLGASAQSMSLPDPAISTPSGPQLQSSDPNAAKRDTTKRKKPVEKDKPAAKEPAEKKSEREFLDGYRNAYALIYTDRDYDAGIAALKRLGHDEHPDVANLIGYSSRKLGRMEDAKVWYERALAADPKHARTWQYYGMWYLEQGERAKAEEYLQTIRNICGTGCEEFRSLKLALSDDTWATY
jgi:tetratricopeptide (TPR) repeat protein